MTDVLILGGGAIGLSLAWELSRAGKSVMLLDRGQLGQESSWAGAGILPPPPAESAAIHPYDRLRVWSFALHAQWNQQLTAQTGIDTGFRRCGGVYLARQAGEAAALRGWLDLLRTEQTAFEDISPRRLAELEPALGEVAASRELRAACLLPDECQVRNPRLLRALAVASAAAGVELRPGVEVLGWETQGGEVTAVRTTAGPLSARRYCLAGGAWTGGLAASLGIPLRMAPVRGQIVLFRAERPPLVRIVNEGPRYLVPRDDGYVLAGSTEEEVGFDKRNTPEAIADLTTFARDLVPALREAAVVKTWAGLRPATHDGLPYLGRAPEISNLFIAAGHFRSGIYLAPVTAVVLSRLLLDQPPGIDLSPFSIQRG